MEGGRITSSEHDDGRPSDATRNPCLAITDGQVVGANTGHDGSKDLQIGWGQ
jgi:hypothetical protein